MTDNWSLLSSVLFAWSPQHSSLVFSNTSSHPELIHIPISISNQELFQNNSSGGQARNQPGAKYMLHHIMMNDNCAGHTSSN